MTFNLERGSKRRRISFFMSTIKAWDVRVELGPFNQRKRSSKGAGEEIGSLLAKYDQTSLLQEFVPPTTKVKFMSDDGFFLDAVDISGGHSLRRMYSGVVNVQGLENTLPRTCTSHLDPTLIENSIAPPSADPNGSWQNCSSSFKCNASQKQFLEGFKMSMLDAVKNFSMSRKNGVFINSRWAHCQAEIKDTWFPENSQAGNYKGIAVAVGDWYFERAKK